MPMQEWQLPLAMTRVRDNYGYWPCLFHLRLCVLQFLFTSLITGEVIEDHMHQQQDAGSRRQPLINNCARM